MAAMKITASNPPSKLADILASRGCDKRIAFLRRGLTTIVLTKPNAATMAMRSANRPATKSLTASVVTSASNSQPTTSLTAAELMAITPRSRPTLITMSSINARVFIM